jgi:hypothetical protein
MCCFTGPVISVSTTAIFAREAEDHHQYLAYEMELNTSAEVAMVLPLPVPAQTAEDAVKFIDLSAYPTLFSDLYHMMELQKDRGRMGIAGLTPKNLAVQQVGSFEASFVPTIADFARLDERFRLPAMVWVKSAPAL